MRSIAKLFIRNSYNLLNQRNLKRWSKALRNDVVFYYPGHSSFAGEWKGKDGFISFFKKYFDNFPKSQFNIKHICSEKMFWLCNNTIMVEWNMAISAKNGKQFSYDGITVLRLKFFKVASAWDYIYNTDIVLEALGE